MSALGSALRRRRTSLRESRSRRALERAIDHAASPAMRDELISAAQRVPSVR